MRLTEKKTETHHQAIVKAQRLVQSDFDAVNALIYAELKSDVNRINEIVEHLVNSGGKRLRPLLLLLMANNSGYHGDNEHHELAAIIEFIHTSTLLHDDVVDDSSRRRNQATANAVWGNAASVLAGDFLYSRAFQILARRSNIPVMKVLADTTNQLSEGEVMQLINCKDTELSEAQYFEVIRRKTAQLYSATCEIAGIITEPNNSDKHQLCAEFGLRLGMAFQITDDLLDYTADAAITGKNLGDDLAEGKMTLPLIYALAHSNRAEQEIIRQAICSNTAELITEVTEIIRRSQAYDYTLKQARLQVEQAKKLAAELPGNVYRDALEEIADFILLRSY